MTEKRVLLITQQFCPYCQRAKMVLNEALGGEYNNEIEQFVREDDQPRFDELKSKYQFLTVPTFIDRTTGKMLSDSQEETITQFLQEAIG